MLSQGGVLGASPREGLIEGVPLTIDPFYPDYRLPFVQDKAHRAFLELFRELSPDSPTGLA
jgi:hypothetical protein